jgi:hypothetical protein
MKSFLKNIFLFLGIPFLLLLILLPLLSHLNADLLEKFGTDPNIKTLIIGDSHTEIGINDQLIPNSINISQTSEGYIYSYYKLKTVLKNNPNIKIILLGCSYHNFSSYYDDPVMGEYSPTVSSRYFFIIPWKEKLRILNKNKKNLVFEIRKILENGFRNLFSKTGNYSFLGGFKSFSTDKALNENSIKKRISGQYYSSGQLTGFSQMNKSYFLKIIDLCRESNLTIKLLNTPLHKTYLDQVPKKFKDHYYNLVKENKLNIIEFDSLHLDNSCFLPDGDHVSIKGSTLTSKFLRDFLNLGN